jgi:Mce-associated membrane protein
VRVRNPLFFAVVLVALAAVAAGVFGTRWWLAAHDSDARFSATRDEVLRAAEQGAVNLNTLDYRTADEGLRLWQQSTTGDLHDQLVSGADGFLAQVRQAKTVTTARVLSGAVTELDERAGRASAILALEVTVTPATGEPSNKRERLAAQLTRTADGWRLSALGQVPVNAS